jgi:hypothetical protein
MTVGREAIAKHAQASEQRENSPGKEKREAAEVQDLRKFNACRNNERLTR